MGEHSAIEWCNGTWNPHRGCHKVSAGCDNCYMFAGQKRFGNDPSVVVRAAKETFDSPLKWKEPMRIFTCSWSDFFIKEADEWRDEAWDIIRDTPHHTYLILTKRPELVATRLPDDWCGKYGHVWLGVTAENQEQADKRIPLLLLLKSLYPWLKVFVSIEPMIESIDLNPWIGRTPKRGYGKGSGIDWVILGGESGPGARPMHPDWVRSIRDQCVNADVPFFFKQWGEWYPIESHEDDVTLKGSDAVVYINGGFLESESVTVDYNKYDGLMRRVGKKKAGALLDDEEYKEVPE